jgi:ubiquinone/menaquinone biosynthesis C-methylase UbiE
MTEQLEGKRYSHGYASEVVDFFQKRTATKDASFVLPHLRVGMTVLDCGSGPGTITIGLGEIVQPGAVIGIDIEPSQVQLATQLAERRAVSNISFQVANMTALPFPDDWFDVVFSNAGLQHVPEPQIALREMYRVLKPGGLIGIRNDDRGPDPIIDPLDPMIERTWTLFLRLWEHDGGHPTFSRRQRAALRATGFVKVRGSASTECHGDADATRSFGEMLAGYWLSPEFGDRVTALGWTTQEEMVRMSEAWRLWGQHPDAYWAETWCEAIGWKPGT